MRRIYFLSLLSALCVFFGCTKELLRDNKLDGKLIPTLTTAAVTNITAAAASGGGTISSDGGLPVTARGVCFSASNTNPDLTSSTTSDGGGTGSFTSTITGLSPNTKYNVRAYATNLVGTAYGAAVTFTTPSTVATVTTVPITNITSSSVVTGGTIIADGGGAISAKGVCWSLTNNATIALTTRTSDGSGSSSYTSTITGLQTYTVYYVRAYVTNTAGTVYGNELIFQTAAKLPTLTASTATGITSNAASVAANITDDGGGLTARGVCWGLSSGPTTALTTKTTDASPVKGSYTGALTGLTPGTLYYVRAYATNPAGTAYSNEITLQTTSSTPVLTTAAITNITQNGASSGGNITDDAGSSITVRGVCWSTTSTPTTSNSKTTDGTGKGTFISSITGLSALTTYYVRAYATNSAGTSYGDQMSFQTTNTSPPTVTTTAASGTTAASSTLGGNVTSNGNDPLTARGIVWNTSTLPTLANNVLTDPAKTTGAFSLLLSGLSPGTQYFYRAYATNSLGTSYGTELTFTTLTTLPVVSATAAATAITTTSASSGGTITSDGGATISARGVCWSTTTAPTISNTKTTNGSGTGTFTSNLTGLVSGTRYYVRAYATSAAGTSYGPEISFTTL